MWKNVQKSNKWLLVECLSLEDKSFRKREELVAYLKREANKTKQSIAKQTTD